MDAAAQGSSESAETSALKHFNFGNKLPCYAKIELTLNWLVEKKKCLEHYHPLLLAERSVSNFWLFLADVT